MLAGSHRRTSGPRPEFNSIAVLGVLSVLALAMITYSVGPGFRNRPRTDPPVVLGLPPTFVTPSAASPSPSPSPSPTPSRTATPSRRPTTAAPSKASTSPAAVTVTARYDTRTEWGSGFVA